MDTSPTPHIWGHQAQVSAVPPRLVSQVHGIWTQGYIWSLRSFNCPRRRWSREVTRMCYPSVFICSANIYWEPTMYQVRSQDPRKKSKQMGFLLHIEPASSPPCGAGRQHGAKLLTSDCLITGSDFVELVTAECWGSRPALKWNRTMTSLSFQHPSLWWWGRNWEHQQLHVGSAGCVPARVQSAFTHCSRLPVIPRLRLYCYPHFIDEETNCSRN